MNSTMEKRKTLLVGIAAGTGVAALVIAIAFAFQSFSESSAVDNSVCWSDQQFESAIRFPMAKPSWVPTGYSLQCQVATPYQAMMLYSEKPMGSKEIEQAMRQDIGIIVVVTDDTLGGLNTDLPGPQARIDETTRLLTSDLKEKMQFRYITVNGYPGWSREAGDYGSLTTQYGNGTVISTEKTEEPARVEFNRETTNYVITAFRPADELIKVAESIPTTG